MKKDRANNDRRQFRNKEISAGNKRPYETKKPSGWQNEAKKPEKDERFQIEGRNSVLEALKNERPIDKLFVKKGEYSGTLRLIISKAKELGVVISEVNSMKLDEIAHSRNHQGVIAVCPVKEYSEVSDILNKAREKGEKPFIIILDSITDTYNLGAIIRSAEASGAHGVIIPKRRAATLTGMVAKAAAGAIEHVLVARVSNIVNVIESLKAQGVWIVCADFAGEPCYNTSMNDGLALVIGGEGEGVGRLIKEKSDFVVKIPMYGEISSLNSSVAAGILMYEVVRQRKW